MESVNQLVTDMRNRGAELQICQQLLLFYVIMKINTSNLILIFNVMCFIIIVFSRKLLI